MKLYLSSLKRNKSQNNSNDSGSYEILHQLKDQSPENNSNQLKLLQLQQLRRNQQQFQAELNSLAQQKALQQLLSNQQQNQSQLFSVTNIQGTATSTPPLNREEQIKKGGVVRLTQYLVSQRSGNSNSKPETIEMSSNVNSGGGSVGGRFESATLFGNVNLKPFRR